MRVLDITSAFSNSCGGIKRYYREKAKALPRLGVECHFAVPGEARSSEAFGEGTLHRLPGPPMPGNDAYRLFGLRAGIGELIQRLEPDVIEVASHYALPDIVLRAARRAKKRPRVVGYFHSHPRQVVENITHGHSSRSGGDALAEVVWSFFRRQHRRYDATLVASPTLGRELSDRGFPRVHEVGLGVDVEVFSPAGRAPRGAPPTICYSGRFTVDKELPVLLAAFDRVHAATGARLLLVGDGPMRPQLEAFALSRPAVTVGPYLDSPAGVAGVLASSDVVVVSSRSETFSLSTAEAIACGALVVGPTEGAVADLIHYTGAGRCFRAGDAGSLGDALVAALSADESARSAQGAEGRARMVERYTWSAVMERLVGVYRDALAAPVLQGR